MLYVYSSTTSPDALESRNPVAWRPDSMFTSWLPYPHETPNFHVSRFILCPFCLLPRSLEPTIYNHPGNPCLGIQVNLASCSPASTPPTQLLRLLTGPWNSCVPDEATVTPLYRTRLSCTTSCTSQDDGDPEDDMRF